MTWQGSFARRLEVLLMAVVFPVALVVRCLRYLQSIITPLTRKSLGRFTAGCLGSRTVVPHLSGPLRNMVKVKVG